VFDTSTERFGTYAQFGVGTALVLGNTGWLGYSRVDYRIGDNIEGVGQRRLTVPLVILGQLLDAIDPAVHSVSDLGRAALVHWKPSFRHKAR
jgi:hypothetical protein